MFAHISVFNLCVWIFVLNYISMKMYLRNCLYKLAKRHTFVYNSAFKRYLIIFLKNLPASFYGVVCHSLNFHNLF